MTRRWPSDRLNILLSDSQHFSAVCQRLEPILGKKGVSLGTDQLKTLRVNGFGGARISEVCRGPNFLLRRMRHRHRHIFTALKTRSVSSPPPAT